MTATTIPVATVGNSSLLIAISDNEVDSGTGFATASPASHPFAVRTKIGICHKIYSYIKYNIHFFFLTIQK